MIFCPPLTLCRELWHCSMSIRSLSSSSSTVSTAVITSGVPAWRHFSRVEGSMELWERSDVSIRYTGCSIHTVSVSHTYTVFSHTHIHTYTVSVTHTYTHTQCQSDTHTQSVSVTHTHIHTQSVSVTHTHTYTHTHRNTYLLLNNIYIFTMLCAACTGVPWPHARECGVSLNVEPHSQACPVSGCVQLWLQYQDVDYAHCSTSQVAALTLQTQKAINTRPSSSKVEIFLCSQFR